MLHMINLLKYYVMLSISVILLGILNVKILLVKPDNLGSLNLCLDAFINRNFTIDFAQVIQMLLVRNILSLEIF